MKFSEETLEHAVIELFHENGIPHFNGETIHKEMSEVLLRNDLKQFLLNEYSDDPYKLIPFHQMPMTPLAISKRPPYTKSTPQQELIDKWL